MELLLGDIPDRALFRQDSLRRSLQPYFQLTQGLLLGLKLLNVMDCIEWHFKIYILIAVRAGNLGLFTEVLENFGPRFQNDQTFTLILRLRHNVIKTGVRMISLSYSRISFYDIAQKLQLDSPEDAEYIVSKVNWLYMCILMQLFS